VFAVLGDTHIPDRVDSLHPQLLGLLAENGPDQVLVTGDISQRSVLDDLAQIAPILAARGNRDGNWSPSLPMEVIVQACGVKLLLLHGHGGWGHYFLDKADHTVRGYRLERYRKYFTQKYPDADGYVFGHSHTPENTVVEGKLFFNPGSACLGGKADIPPSFGILRIDSSGTMDGRIIPLEGYRIENKKWVELDDYPPA
jgi:hypothetical protein